MPNQSTVKALTVLALRYIGTLRELRKQRAQTICDLRGQDRLRTGHLLKAHMAVCTRIDRSVVRLEELR